MPIASQSHLSRLCGNAFDPKLQHIQMRLHHTGGMILPQSQGHLDFSPDCCSVFDLSWPHIPWRNQPCPSRGAEASVAKQPHIGTGQFYDVQTLTMVLPIQCWSGIYTQLVLCQHLSCWCSGTARCKVIGIDRDNYIVLRVSSHFNWQSMI